VSSQLKDYYLLRNFDVDAVKRGEKFCDKNGRSAWSFLDGPDTLGNCVLVYEPGGSFVIVHISELRMKPLSWVEGKPVYKGDLLRYIAPWF
jgi:hypothetical protein